MLLLIYVYKFNFNLQLKNFYLKLALFKEYEIFFKRNI